MWRAGYAAELGFKPGDIVRVKGQGRVTSAIFLLYPDVFGGVRLHDSIGGFVSWNVEDLVLIKTAA